MEREASTTQQSEEIGGTGQKRGGGHLRQAVYKLRSHSSRQQQIHTQVVNNIHTNISQDDKFPISHTCGKQLISLILLKYRNLQPPSIRTLAVPRTLIRIRNTSSKCLLSGWITAHKSVASCSASPRGRRLKCEYQRSRQCKEILSDRKVLRYISQNVLPQEAEKFPFQRDVCQGSAHFSYSTSHISNRVPYIRVSPTQGSRCVAVSSHRLPSVADLEGKSKRACWVKSPSEVFPWDFLTI